MWAEFEGMKTKPGYPIIKGPFLVEVYELRRSRTLPQFGARLLGLFHGDRRSHGGIGTGQSSRDF